MNIYYINGEEIKKGLYYYKYLSDDQMEFTFVVRFSVMQVVSSTTLSPSSPPFPKPFFFLTMNPPFLAVKRRSSFPGK